MTFFAFFIPLIFEYVLNIITFPMQAIGDRSNLPTFDYTYQKMETRYLFYDLWKLNSYFYFFVFITMFSFVMASFSTFAVSITMLPKVNFKILTFLPTYFVFTMISALGRILGININYRDYLMAFDTGEKIDMLYLAVSLLLLFTSIIITNHKAVKEI